MNQLPEKIINRLKYGKTANGEVGMRVCPTGKNQRNKAWIKIKAIKGADCIAELGYSYFLCYEVEYIELQETYNADLHGYDADLFLVKKEIYYNIKDETALEEVLSIWMDDFTQLKHIGNIDYP